MSFFDVFFLMKPKPYPEQKIDVPRFCEDNGFYTTRQRSYNMSRIKGKNTKPEKIFKNACGMPASATAAIRKAFQVDRILHLSNISW